MHFRKEWHRRGALKTSATPPEKPLVQPRRVGTRWRIPHEPDVLGSPGKHSRHLWVWLGQRYHTRRGQRSRVVIPGERGLALRCSDRHLVIRGGTEGNGWGTPLSRGPSPNQRYPRRLRSAWGVRTSTWGSPHRNPQITSDSTRMLCRPVLCQDERQIAAEAEGLRHVWHSGVYCATPRWSCPHMKNMNHPRKLPQRAECPDTWGSDRDRPEAPEIDRTQKRTGDKTSLKRRDHPCTLLEKSALLVLKHAGGWPPHTPSVTVFTGTVFSLSRETATTAAVL